MSEPMWLGGDPASYADTMEETQSAECGECGQESEFPAYSEYSHRTVNVMVPEVSPPKMSEDIGYAPSCSFVGRGSVGCSHLAM